MTLAVDGDDALELAQAAFDRVEANASAAALLAERAVRIADSFLDLAKRFES